MFNSRTVLLAIALGLPVHAEAQTALSRPTLELNNNATIRANGEGAITGPILNFLLGNTLYSYVNILSDLGAGVFTAFGIPLGNPNSLVTNAQVTWGPAGPCTAGSISADTSYLYVCVSTNVVEKIQFSGVVPTVSSGCNLGLGLGLCGSPIGGGL